VGYERKEFKGNAAPTTLTGTIDSDDLSLTIANGTNWPTGGANGKFVIVIDRGEPGEEKLLCSARSGTTITVSARGHDNTTASGHTSGKSVEHVLDAETIDQVNRLANLLAVKGSIIAHNGTNPVALSPGSVDADDDGKVLQLQFAASTGLVFAALTTVTIDPSAPVVDGPVRLWYDSTAKQLRPSDGANWLTPVQLPSFASSGARDTYFAESAGHACWRSDLGFAEIYSGSKWKPLGRGRFANSTARDAYYTSPDDGDQAYLTASHEDQIYRSNEWVTVSQKVTIAATQPVSGMVTGDLWLQPVA
jgi:hypothetical protein